MEERVIAGKVLLRPLEYKKKVGKIWIPETSRKSSIRCEAVLVGESTEEELMEVKPGDTVIISIHAGTKLKTRLKHKKLEREYILVSHRDIFYIC